MELDIEMLIVIGIGILVLLYLYNRATSSTRPQAQSDETYMPPRGQERPSYDDPDIQGRGSFGRSADPDREGLFRFPSRPRKSNSSFSDRKKRSGAPSTRNTGRAVGASEHYDDDEIEGRGSFGG